MPHTLMVSGPKRDITSFFCDLAANMKSTTSLLVIDTLRTSPLTIASIAGFDQVHIRRPKTPYQLKRLVDQKIEPILEEYPSTVILIPSIPNLVEQTQAPPSLVFDYVLTRIISMAKEYNAVLIVGLTERIPFMQRKLKRLMDVSIDLRKMGGPAMVSNQSKKSES
jgi:hypothetical protein